MLLVQRGCEGHRVDDPEAARTSALIRRRASRCQSQRKVAALHRKLAPPHTFAPIFADIRCDLRRTIAVTRWAPRGVVALSDGMC